MKHGVKDRLWVRGKKGRKKVDKEGRGVIGGKKGRRGKRNVWQII